MEDKRKDGSGGWRKCCWNCSKWSGVYCEKDWESLGAQPGFKMRTNGVDCCHDFKKREKETEHSQDWYCRGCVHFGLCNVILKDGEDCSDRIDDKLIESVPAR